MLDGRNVPKETEFQMICNSAGWAQLDYRKIQAEDCVKEPGSKTVLLLCLDQQEVNTTAAEITTERGKILKK